MVNTQLKITYIINKANNLNKTQHIEIYKILRENKVFLTKNNNGIFVELFGLNENIIQKLYNYIQYCISNNKLLLEKEKEIKKEKNKLVKKKTQIANTKKKVKKEYKMVGNKIILKKEKIKYSGIKSKILKNYKDISQQVIITHCVNDTPKIISNEDEFEYIEEYKLIEEYSDNDSESINENDIEY